MLAVRNITRRWGIILLLLLTPVMLQAQTATKASAKESNYARAITLRAQAVELYDQPSRAADAARLHLAEVELRSKTDVEAIESLAMAAHLFNYAKRPMEARKVMERAGDRALALGHIGRAAQAYVDAAFLAQKRQNTSETQRLVVKAYLLTESPWLPREQRNTIRSRIQSNATLARLLK